MGRKPRPNRAFAPLERDIQAELSLKLGIAYAVTFGRDQPILERWGVVRKAAA